MMPFQSRSLQKFVIGLAGLLLLLLVTGCSSIGGVGPNVNLSGTPEPGTPSTGPAVAGSIAFTGPVQSVSSSSIAVKLPDGQVLTAAIVTGQTELSGFSSGLPAQGQTVDITATANTNGSFTATEIKASDSTDTTDQNTVTFKGVVTGAVASDNVLHFRVGTQDFSFALNSQTDLSDFQNDEHSIGNNQSIKVKVLYQGNTVTVLKVSLENGSNDQNNNPNG